MTLSCPSCQLEVRIDTSRLTPGRTHQAACPRCKTVFPVGTPAAEAAPRPAVAAATAPAPAPPGPAVADARAEAWLQHELEKLRMQIKEEVLRDVLRHLPEGASARTPAPAREGLPGGQARSFEALVIADEGP